MEAVRTSETSVDNNFTRQYIPEDSSEQQININLSGILSYRIKQRSYFNKAKPLPKYFIFRPNLFQNKCLVYK
jgi:hypothetical protein